MQRMPTDVKILLSVIAIIAFGAMFTYANRPSQTLTSVPKNPILDKLKSSREQNEAQWGMVTERSQDYRSVLNLTDQDAQNMIDSRYFLSIGHGSARVNVEAHRINGAYLLKLNIFNAFEYSTYHMYSNGRNTMFDYFLHDSDHQGIVAKLRDGEYEVYQYGANGESYKQ